METLPEPPADQDQGVHTLTPAEIGSTITVVVSYIDGQGTSESVTSAAVGPVTNANDPPTGDVTIDGRGAVVDVQPIAGCPLQDEAAQLNVSRTTQVDAGSSTNNHRRAVCVLSLKNDWARLRASKVVER